MTTRIIHTEDTLRQLAEARAKHASTCSKIIATCFLCSDHFGLERHTGSGTLGTRS